MVGRVSAYLRQNVLGLIAIFLALTAGPYAIKKAPKNSVVSKSIKNGQVQNADLGPAAVTSDKLGDGAVSPAKLGFDAATKAELDATKGELDATKLALSSSGTINDAANPVEWSKLKGVPSGFADGFDRLFGLSGGDTSGDTTPSVENLSLLSVNFGSPLTITDLVDGVSGQVVTLHDTIGGGNVTINDGAPFFLSANWISTDSDTLTLIRVFGSIWVEVARSVN